MEYKLKIRKGLNIRIKGQATQQIHDQSQPDLFAIKPLDFAGHKPKIVAKPDTYVKIGTPLIFDKYHPEVVFVSPVSGKVTEIVRGEKRKVLQINIENDHKNEFEKLDVPNPDSGSREQIVEFFCKAGLWPFFKQRPYGTLADTKAVPKSIFISLYDTAPLAPDYEFLLDKKRETLLVALKFISKLTEGNIFIGLPKDSKLKNSFSSLERVNIIEISGPHPAGNVGTLINKFDPINKDEIIFTLYAQDLLHIGNTIEKAYFSAERTVVLSGSEVKDPVYINTWLGASVANTVTGKYEGDVRVISGNVLTGTNIGNKGMLGFFENQICIIPEGNVYEFFGWVLPGFKKFSVSRTYFSFLTPNKKYRINTNFHGGHRPFVMTGQYEKVCPLNILPQHLIKAIIIKDIDKMEQLGIYEVVEEDLALCEFVCTSKTDVQKILREGLDMMKEEMS